MDVNKSCISITQDQFHNAYSIYLIIKLQDDTPF